MAAGLDKLGAPRARLKRSQVSLFGGAACGIAVFILVLLLAGGPTPLNIAIGLAIGVGLGAWVRLADL